MVEIAERLSKTSSYGRKVSNKMHLKTLAKMPAHTSSSDSRTSDLGGFLSILSRNAAAIVLLTMLMTGLALAYLAVAKPVYTASTSIFIDPRSRKLLPEEFLQTNLGSDLVLVESQLAIIGSDGVLKRVVEKMNLVDDPEFNSPPSTGVMSQIKALIRGPAQEISPESRALSALSKNVKVKRAQKTYVVEVEVSSSSPVKAARLTEAVVDAYIEDQSASKAEEIRKANKLIDDRLGELRKQLREAETRVDEFKKANKILTSEGGLVTEQQLTRLSSELITARAVAAESKARQELVQSALKNGGSPEFLPDAIRSGLVQKLREQYAQVARREAALSSQLQARHPVLIEARSQLQEIKSQIAAELKRIATSAKSDFQFANNRVEELSRSLEAAKSDVSRTNTAQIRLRELEQDVTASRDLLNTFLARAKQTQEQQTLTLAEARVISPPSVPSRPSKPITWLILSLGVLGGLGLGIAYALIRDQLETSEEAATPQEAEADVDTLGALPVLGSGGLGRLLRPRSEAPGFSDVMAAIADPNGSAQTRAFRQAVLRLVTRLRARHQKGTPDIALVTAAHKGVGVSSTALSVAYAAAMSGEKVLLVDASSSDTDLSNALAADFEHRDLIVLDNVQHLRSITRRDARTGLVFLPIALADLRTLRTHQRNRLAAGLSALAAPYDLVVIDAGALLEDESATALMPIADQIIIVARSGVTSPAAMREAQRMLEPYEDSLVGNVINMTGKLYAR